MSEKYVSTLNGKLVKDKEARNEIEKIKQQMATLTPSLQTLLGKESIGNETHFVYYDGTRLVPVAMQAPTETTDWGILSAVSDKIAEGDDPAEYDLAVGDKKDIVLSDGDTLTVQILDFNHDTLADGSGKKAGITWGLKNLMAGRVAYNYTVNWSINAVRISTMREIYSKLPEDLKRAIKPVRKTTKYTITTSSHSDLSVDTADDLFLFTDEEVDITNGYAFWRGKDTINRAKSLLNGDGALSNWVLRNTNDHNESSSYSDEPYIHYIGVDGKLVSDKEASTSTQYGICFGFCI